LTSAQIVRGFLTRHAFNHLLGMELVRTHRDGVTIQCRVRPELMNTAGTVHGGVTASLADAAVGSALHFHFGGARRFTTVEMKINYFRPVTEGRVIARSHLVRVGSSIAVGRVDLRDEHRRGVGLAIVTYMLLDVTDKSAAPRPPGAKSR
jgi:acyl-CoA thioesterase